MAATERPQSRKVTRKNFVLSGQRVWVVDGAASHRAALLEVDISTGESFPGDPLLRAKDYAVDVIAGSNTGTVRGYKVTWDYTSGEPGDNAPPDGDDDDGEKTIRFLETNVDARGAFIDVYRTHDPANNKAIAFPANGNNPVEGADIGGKKVDVSGEAVSFGIDMMTVSISHNVRVQNSRRPDVSKYKRFLRTRNQTSFLGFERGKLLYGAFSVRTVEKGVISVNHRLHYHDQFHLAQVPKKSHDQLVIKDDTDTTGIFHATTVYFIQPFPQSKEFDGLGIPFR